MVVENKPGAGARIAAETLKNAAPDGSTLMLAPIVVPVLAPLVFSKLPYNPGTDFAPVAHVANFQFGLSVNASHPAKNMQELVAWYKANPAQANFGSPAPGSLPHFFGVMIATGAGLDLVHVPFNGGGPLMNALVGNQVSSAIDTVVDQIEMLRGGKIRILATSAAARSPLLPDVPDLRRGRSQRRGRHGWFAVYAPAKTPAATIQQLNAAVNKALATPELRERFGKLGLEPTGGTPGRARGDHEARQRALGAGRQGLGLPRRLSHGDDADAFENAMTDLFENPMGLMGFEFVEFASPTPNVLEPLLEKLGFALVARHRSKDVVLYRQGGINFIVNREPGARRRTLPPNMGLVPVAWRSGSGIRISPTTARSSSAPSRSRCPPARWSCACPPSRASAARRCT